MATQSISAFRQFSGLTPALSLRYSPVSRPHRPHPSVPLKELLKEKQAREKQQLILDLLPLVKRVALKIRERLPAHVEVDDLVGDGVLGLMDAIGKFDPSKRVKLESYARHRIRGAILDGLRGADPVSRDLRRMKRKVQQLYCELESKLSRAVRDEEMAGALGISLARWNETLNRIANVGSDCSGRLLTASPTSYSVSQQADPELIAGQPAGPFEHCYRAEQCTILRQALSRLRQREREIIILYYWHELTMNQIAGQLGVDTSRVSQVHSAALARLKAGVHSLAHSSGP